MDLLWDIGHLGDKVDRVAVLPQPSDSILQARRDDGLVFIPAQFAPGLWCWWCVTHKKPVGECRCGARED